MLTPEYKATCAWQLIPVDDGVFPYVSVRDAMSGITAAVAGENYRSLHSVIMPLSHLAFVTGSNGVGKSNLYGALRLLVNAARGDVVEVGDAEALNEAIDDAFPGSRLGIETMGAGQLQASSGQSVARLATA